MRVESIRLRFVPLHPLLATWLAMGEGEVLELALCELAKRKFPAGYNAEQVRLELAIKETVSATNAS